MKKLAAAAIALLCVLCLTTVCIAEGSDPTGATDKMAAGLFFPVDLSADGTEEVLHVYPDSDGYSYFVSLAVNGPDGMRSDIFELTSGSIPSEQTDYFSTRLDLYMLENGKLYVEARVLFEGISQSYMLFSLKDGALVLETHIADPGYSDGYGLIDGLTGDELYFSMEMGDKSTEGLRILNERFEGIPFEIRALPMGGFEPKVCGAALPEEAHLCGLENYERATDFAALRETLPAADAGEEQPAAPPKLVLATLAPTGAPEGQNAQQSVPQFSLATPVPAPTAAMAPLATPVPAATESAKTVRATGDINVRASADKNAAILGMLSKGGTAEYLGEQKKDYRGVTWYKISFGGKTGWVSSKYSELSGSSSGASSSSSSSSSSSASSGKVSSANTNAKGSVVKAVGGNLNIRSGPGLNYKDIGTIKEGGSATYLGKSSKDNRGVTWYNISYNGKKGWVSSKYGKLR